MIDESRPSGRVVVTGVGGVTPLGTGVDVFWPRMLAGESAAGPVTRLDTSEFTTRIAAEVKDFDAADWLDRKEARRIDPFISYAVASATTALEDSGLDVSGEAAEHVGVLVGSGIGGLITMAEQMRRLILSGPSKVSPFLVPHMIPDMASGYISILHGLKGPNTCVVTACATGANSIGDAYHIVKRGEAVAMLAGGTEAPVNEIALSGFCAARAMTTRNDDPTHASRPFDLDRDGFLIAEGSAVLVLEDRDHAKARGARIYAEILGYGMSGDAYHMTAPDPEGDGAMRAMKAALRGARIEPSAVDYINAHGTSTSLNDRLETLAIKRVFGDSVPPISSSKSMIGHTLGAAGAIEALVCILAMRDGVMPPTINYDTPDPDCDLDYVPNTARKKELKTTLSNSFGFGGHNVCLVLGRGE